MKLTHEREDDVSLRLVSGLVMCLIVVELGELGVRGYIHLFSSFSLQLSSSSVQSQITLGLSSVLVAPRGLSLAINKASASLTN